MPDPGPSLNETMTVNGGTAAGTPTEPGRSTPLGKYDLFARIGRGGMADVFLAVARGPMGFSKLAVIKRLREAADDQPTMVDMFLDEARLAARLQHPNIVHTYEVGAHDGAYFIAMEYLEGQPLHKISRSQAARAQLTPVVWCHIIAQALGGLHHAHELCDYDGTALGIVHRDVSPHNIFLTYSGEVKVVDFGIAKAVVNTTETATGILKGKVNYMAPEQVVGNADRRSDVYSMGLSLWEVLAGKGAYRGEAVQVLNAVLNEPVPSLAAACPEIDPRLDAIVQKATAKELEERYQSADEFREALLDYVRESGEIVREAAIGKVVSTVFHETREKLAAQVKLHMAALPSTPASNSGEVLLTHTGAALPSLSEFTVTSSGTPPSLDANPGAVSLAHSAAPPATLSGGAAPAATPTPVTRRAPLVAGLVALALLASGLVAWKLGARDDSASRTATTPVKLAIMIESQPADATIEFEGRVLGRTPATVEVPPGRSTLVLRKEGYGPEAVEVEVTSDRPTTKRLVTLATKTVAELPGASAATSATGAAPQASAATSAAPHAAPASTPASRHPTTTSPPARPPVTAGPAPSGTAAADRAGGFLSLTTFPWSRVSEGGHSLGTTPLFRVPLSAGTHVLVLDNPDDGIRTTYSVTIKPGEATSRSVELK
jgi:eukaryotic-like serine/threonine-protein kinase